MKILNFVILLGLFVPEILPCPLLQKKGQFEKALEEYFEQACSLEATFTTRLNSLKKISLHNSPAAARSLLNACQRILSEAKEIEESLEWIREKLKPLQKDQLTDEEWKEFDHLEEERKEYGEKLSQAGQLLEKSIAFMENFTTRELRHTLLREGLQSPSWWVQAAVLEAAGRMGEEDAVPLILPALKEKSPVVRGTAVESLANLGAKEAVPHILCLLKDKHWQVKLSCIQALKSLEGKEGIPALIEALAQEEGSVERDAAQALESITGERHGTQFEAWRDWWNLQSEKSGAKKVKARKGSSAPPFKYHGIEVHSCRVIFVIDISDSMNEDARSKEIGADGLAKRNNVERSKLSVAKEELKKAVIGFPGSAYFNIIFYNHRVTRWRNDMVQASFLNKNDALAAILRAKASGGTNIFDALEEAFTLGGIGAWDKNYSSKLDAILFLSDGAPSAGRIRDTLKILEEIRRMNKHRKLVIHTVGVGLLHDEKFMRKLAAENGGTYTCIK